MKKINRYSFLRSTKRRVPTSKVRSRISIVAPVEYEDDGKKKKKVRIKSSGSNEQAIEKARKQERDKLHDRIEASETEARKLRKRLAKAEASIEAFNEAKTTEGKVDVTELLERAHKKFLKHYKKAEEGEDTELREKVDSLEKEVTKYRVGALRRRLIAEAGGTDVMISEMVTGETEEEIEKSIEKAIAAYDRVAGKKKGKDADDDDSEDDDIDGDDDEEDDESEEGDEEDEEEEDDEKKLKSGKGKKRRKAPPSVPSGANGKRGSGAKGDKVLGNVRNLSPADYAAKRPKILERLRANYPGGANPFGAGRRSARG